MARIPRVLYRLFGVDGPTADFGTFGSKAAGAPVYTKDVAVIQSLDAWANGWKNALQSGERQPFVEDWNAKDFVHGYMLAYLMQEGVPEWNVNTEYHQNSIVKKPGTFELYASLVNNNTGNTLPTQTDDVNWKFLFPVRTSQLLGTLTDAQLDAIAASKITGTVADAQIASMAATKLLGLVQDAQIQSLAASKIVGIQQVSSVGASCIVNQMISSDQIVQLGREDWDILGEFNPSTYKFTAQATGRYLVTAAVSGGTIASGDEASVFVFKNNGTMQTEVLGCMSLGYKHFVESCSRIVQLTAGDTVWMKAYRAASGASWTIYGSTDGGSQTQLQVLRVG
jgi:C1q domain